MISSQQKSFLKGGIKNIRLEEIIKNNIISNAYIFDGPEGVGRKEAAIDFITRIIDKSNPNNSVIEQIKSNNFPDLKLIEPTYLIKGKLISRSELEYDLIQKNKAIIRVDQIREIRKFLAIKSIQAEKKFVLIEDAHLLNEAASNCLLKTLEEPENGLFILITSNVNNLLETIRSRCQHIRFQRLTTAELLDQLKKNEAFTEEIENKLTNLKDLIYLANGSPKKLWENIVIWLEIPKGIKDKISNPTSESIESLVLAKQIIDELDMKQQDFLVEFIQYIWWKQTRDTGISRAFENLKINLKNNVQPRLAWEVCLLRITIKDL